MEFNLKNKRTMWNDPTHPGWSHLRASLPERIEIARTCYRFYVGQNVYVFDRGKIEWLQHILVEEAFDARDRQSLERIFEVHEELRAKFKFKDPKLNRWGLRARFLLGRPPYAKRHKTWE